MNPLIWLRKRGAANIEIRRKQAEEKYWKLRRIKNEEHKEITAINIFSLTFYIKNYILLENIV